MIAFVIKNDETDVHFKEFAVTVDSLESLTGIDFFPALPDSIEYDYEAREKAECWFLLNMHIY